MDGNWKYMSDSYNGVSRWMPLNADIAGLLARTETDFGAWFSPAGQSRGNISNVIKLAFNPTKSMRDGLYSIGINNVFAFPGSGTVLWGDKTLQTKPSAFDRIQVRRLFNILEKSFATSANFVLFEQNDAFTRQNFISQIEPVLRDVQNRRGLENYRVVCDESNNSSASIDRGEFIADIYLQPTRSIQFVKLNFVANNSGSFFTEG
jgi:phage tail sheath protein FI